MTDLYCVFGNPVAHSKSPVIHAAFARLTGHALRYEARLAPVDDFAGSLGAFLAEGGKGCNITVPFKEQAWALAAVRSRRAEKAGAVTMIIALQAYPFTAMALEALFHTHQSDGVVTVTDWPSLIHGMSCS